MTEVPLPTNTPLSIALIGVGGIGSTFAFHLARAGHDVTVVARPGSLRLQQLQRDGGIVSKTGERAETNVVENLDEQVAYDLVVVTTATHQVEVLLPALRRSKAQCVHFMFNTFTPEHLQNALGAQHCTFGMPFVMAILEQEGILNFTVSSSRKTLHNDQRWVKLFGSAGIPSAFEADMPLWLRCHVPMCVAMESISVLGQQRGGGASWAEATAVARGLHGGFAIIKGLGYRLYPSAKGLINASPIPLVACMLWCVSRITAFRELLATGKNECRALIDDVAAAAVKANPAHPAAVKALLDIKPANS